MTNDKVCVIGHKSPDLDSVAAAIAYANLRNSVEKTDIYKPAVAGEINQETKFALEKFGFAVPELLASAADQVIILVDHNEMSQAVDGADKAKIITVVDHHKIDFKCAEPILFFSFPWGATCSILANMFRINNLELDKKMAGLMLAAILIDTVITKSPTCTEMDKQFIDKLAVQAGIEDWHTFGMELFKIRSNVSAMPAEEIIKSDFKDFIFKAGKFGIGQIETVDLAEFDNKAEAILEKLAELKNSGSYHTVILFITDIIKEGSLFLVSTNDQTAVESALNAKLENSRIYIDGILSRKKQVAPKFAEVFDK